MTIEEARKVLEEHLQVLREVVGVSDDIKLDDALTLALRILGRIEKKNLLNIMHSIIPLPYDRQILLTASQFKLFTQALIKALEE